MPSLSIGDVLKGKYRIERVLGEGGMGVVVAAYHLALEQRVAIKFLRPAMQAHAAVVERFAREAKAASRIQSDHVARVLDVDSLEDGTPFLVMEMLDGVDLSVVRREKRPLSVPVAVTYILEACEAIGEAHRMGIVHRDIKPANLFLAQRGDGRTRVKVLDFGISKLNTPGGADSNVTKTTSVMGSAEYMSPEQMLASRDVDARADIWAIGVTLYELLTATVPFPGEAITLVCALVMTTEAEAPSTLRRDLPRGLDQVILKCLAKDRADRFGSVAELVHALAPFASVPVARSSDQGIAYTGPVNGTHVSPSNSGDGVPTAHLDAPAPMPTNPPAPAAMRADTRLTGSTTTRPISSDPIPTLTPTGRRTWPFAAVVLGVVSILGLAAIAVKGRAGAPPVAAVSSQPSNALDVSTAASLVSSAIAVATSPSPDPAPTSTTAAPVASAAVSASATHVPNPPGSTAHPIAPSKQPQRSQTFDPTNTR